MTFASLRALHAIVGAAIDDIEHVYRPPSSRRPSHASTTRSTCTSSSRSHYSGPDSDLDADEADISCPPTPTSPNPGVRFASSNTVRVGRQRAQTLPGPLPHSTSGPMPPPILKQPPFDFPSLDTPIISANSPSSASQERPNTEPDGIGESPRKKEWKKKCEELTAHPQVIGAVNRLVAACGHMAAIAQKPFLTLCDAAMGYHLPACLRLLEAAHIVEMLREAGPRGMHVEEIAKCISFSSADKGEDKQRIDSNKLSHIMRLLATHHITREVRPNVFANNRISSVMDTGKPWKELINSSQPEKKYEETDGFAAFVGMCTDEIFKAAAYLTDCYLLPERPTDLPPEASLPSPALSNSPPISPSVPPRTMHSASVPTAYGICTPNDSTVSLHSPGGPSSSPMVFAQNPSPSVPKRRGVHHSLDSAVGEPATPSPVTPRSVARPRAFSIRRLSTRSTTPTQDTPRSPLFLEPETPRSSAASIHGSKSTLSRRHDRDHDHDDFAHLNTPRSPPSSRDSLNSLSSGGSNAQPVRKKPSFGSFGSLGLGKKASMSALAHAFRAGGTGKKTSPPMPQSPVTTRSRQASAQGYVDGHMRFVGVVGDEGRSDADQHGQDQSHSPVQKQGREREREGLLGPAFDLRPPALATSPKARTFPGAGPGEEEPGAPFAAMPLPPPVPPKPHYGDNESGNGSGRNTVVSPSAVPPPVPPKSGMRQSPGTLRHAPSSPVLSSAYRKNLRAGGHVPPPLPLSKIAGWNLKDGRVNEVGKEKGVVKGRDHEMYAPFNVAFETRMRYFEWLERRENEFRLKRFGKAMTGTSGWEGPGSVVTGFPWQELPPKSVVVDVGGGIGSTSMLLANAFPQLRFVIQDRQPVAEMGTAAWRTRHPEMLDTGRAVFQAHDFFKPQPPFPEEMDIEKTNVGKETKTVVPAVFLLRVITHDWPDSYVTRILLRLRQAASPNTRLLLADYVLPLACVDEDEDAEPETPDSDSDFDRKLTREPLPGTVRTLAPEGSPLLPNLGKAHANAYWLDLTMRVMFNSQERTLRELAALTLKAGWKITQVTRTEGSLFGHIIAVPVDIPPETLTIPLCEEEGDLESVAHGTGDETLMEIESPPMGDTFLSSVHLPTEDAVKASIARGKAGVLGNSVSEGGATVRTGGGPVRKRERANTFSVAASRGGSGSGREGKSGGGGEGRKGWRSIVKMLSKSQMRGGGAGGSIQEKEGEDPYALTRQPSRR